MCESKLGCLLVGLPCESRHGREWGVWTVGLSLVWLDGERGVFDPSRKRRGGVPSLAVLVDGSFPKHKHKKVTFRNYRFPFRSSNDTEASDFLCT
jgi:hypothetical protein